MAERKDSASLVRLLEVLGYPATEAFVEAKLDAYSSSDAGEVLVDERDGEVIGFLVFDAQLLFHQEGKIGCIMAMAVLESWQGKGVGSGLVREAERRAKEAGCVKISVASGLRRLETHAFYRSLGYEELTKRFVKQLIVE